MEVVKYKHLANSGDLIASLPGMKHVYDKLGKKAVIMQRLNAPATYYAGATHPVVDENGTMVCMSNKQWEMIVPLLEAQEYVERCEIWEGQEFDINLDKIRETDAANIPYGPIEIWQFMTHPLLTCDISQSWLKVPELNSDYSKAKDKVVINITERYRNHLITYYFLKKWEDKLIFAGTKKEHELFCFQNKLEIPLLVVDSFLHLAQEIQSSNFLLGNQSMCYNIANAMKHKRLLEMCKGAPNCYPIGKEGYGFLHQDAFEILMNKFMK